MESQQNNELEQIFGAYAKDGWLECSKCNKIFKDCNLTGKNLSTTDLDIMFSQVKEKSLKKINLKQFECLVEKVGVKLKMEKHILMDKLACQKGPTYAGTKADYNKLHDDKSQYTGVYAKGGPTNVDKNTNYADLGGICDRSEADQRGVKKHQ